MDRGKLLRIFVDEGDRWNGQPLYAAIVEALKADGFAGATVLKGVEGFGARAAPERRYVNEARASDPNRF